MSDHDDVRDNLEFVPLYRMGNHVEAIFLKEVFDTEKIISLFQNLQVTSFPTDVGEQAEIIVMVNQADYDRAKTLIEEARESKAITLDGGFVSE